MLALVDFMRSHSRGCASISANIQNWLFKVALDIFPRTHILMLLLYPAPVGRSPIFLEKCVDLGFGKWIELLDADDSDIGAVLFLSFRDQFIVDFSRAEQQFFGVTGFKRIVEHFLERSSDKILDAADALWMAQNGFRSKDDQRFFRFVQRLSAQQMEELCWV